MKNVAAVAVVLLALAAAPALQAQDRKDPAPAAPKKDGDYPQWTVHGYVAVDFNELYSDTESRDSMTERGIVGQYALGGTLHLAHSLRVELRTCVGCHGFEVQSAYVEFDVAEFASIRAGRIPVPFGSLSQRVAPDQMESSSKPLPYIMGRMVRDKAFNQGIVPAPIIDNGGSVFGNVWLGSAQLGYEVGIVRGLKGDSPDLAFDLSRDFADNNGTPAGSGRVTFTAGAVTVGASGMLGQYDDFNGLDYRIGEVDLTLSMGRWNFRAEGLVRDTEFINAAGNPQFARRLAYAVQLDGPLADAWRFFLLHDFLQTQDLFLSPTGGSSVVGGPGLTDDMNSIQRFVGGLVFTVRPGLLLKGSAEYWNFTDFDDTWVFHFEIVATF